MVSRLHFVEGSPGDGNVYLLHGKKFPDEMGVKSSNVNEDLSAKDIEQSNDFARWISARRRTFFAFCVICFGLGCEYSLIFPSLLYYLKEVIQSKYSQLFYGIALSAYPASSIVGAFTIARYADYSKRTRFVLLMLLACEICGNLLYALPFSPFFPVFGRLIAGLGDVANMVMCGEVVRCYGTNEVTSSISIMVICFSVGFTLSPGLNILFKYFDFHIGPVHVVYANMPGLFMAGCFVVVAALAYALVSDISLKFDLKGQMEKQRSDHVEHQDTVKLAGNPRNNDGAYGSTVEKEETVKKCLNPFLVDSVELLKQDDHLFHSRTYSNPFLSSSEEEELHPCHSSSDDLRKLSTEISRGNCNFDSTKTQPHQSNTSVLLSIITTFDLVLLLVFCFVCSFTLFGFDTLVSLLALNYFHYTAAQTSLIFVVDGVLYGIVLLLLVKLSNHVADFNIIVCAVVVQLLGLLAVLSLSIFHGNIYFNYVCLTAFVLACSTTWCIEEVLTRSLFGKLVPSTCQSYAEGIRRSVSSVAFIISGVSTAGLFKYLTYISLALIGVTLILLVVFLLRRKTLQNPVPLFFDGKGDRGNTEETPLLH